MGSPNNTFYRTMPSYGLNQFIDLDDVLCKVHLLLNERVCQCNSLNRGDMCLIVVYNPTINVNGLMNLA